MMKRAKSRRESIARGWRFLWPLVLLAGLTAKAATGATIDQIKARGELVCGVNTGWLKGFAWRDEAGQWTGFDVDMCRAVAAAVLGDKEKVRFVPLTAAQRLPALASGQVDMLARNTTWTLSRDMDAGISFAVTVYYDGQGFMVKRDSDKTSALQLNGARICVQKATTSERNLENYFHINLMHYLPVYVDTPEAAMEAFMRGDCDALTSDQVQLFALRSITRNPNDYRILPEVISQEPLTLAVRAGDDDWRKVVQWTGFVLIAAEFHGIDSKNVHQVLESARRTGDMTLAGFYNPVGRAQGLQPGWPARVIKQLGNYGEIFERNLGQSSPLKLNRGLNALWNHGGLLYAPPVR